jgi:hypothetical protein
MIARCLTLQRIESRFAWRIRLSTLVTRLMIVVASPLYCRECLFTPI